jgi:hypothetical protein
MIRRLLLGAAVLLLPQPAGAQEKNWLQISQVHDGLWRGRMPFLESHYEKLQALGIRTVLDIRGTQPVQSWVESRQAPRHGLVYWQVPLSFHPLKDGSGEAVLAAMQDVSAYPMYIHCEIDRDRTSAIIGVYRMRVQGWSKEAATAEAHEFGIRRYYIGLNRYLDAGGDLQSRSRLIRHK